MIEVRSDGSYGDLVILPQHEGLIQIGARYYSDLAILLSNDTNVVSTDREILSFADLKRIVETDPFDYERLDLERWIDDNINGFFLPACDEPMTDKELYEYARHMAIEHIWLHLYEIKKEG